MSQPCSAVELILVDARDLIDPELRELLMLARGRGVHCGAALNAGDVAARVDASGCGNLVDFWLGDDDDWPFERVVALSSVEPQRILFVSDDAAARECAANAELRAWDGSLTEIERALP